MSIQDEGGGYFRCDKCGFWGLCVQDLEGKAHLIERHVSQEDVAKMSEEELKRFGGRDRARKVAQDGRLATVEKCGAYRRTTFEALSRSFG